MRTDDLFAAGWAALLGDSKPLIRTVMRAAWDAYAPAILAPPVESAARPPTSGLSDSAQADDLARWVNRMDTAETFLLVVLGAPGTGKSLLCARIVDRRRRQTFVLGIEQAQLDRAGVGKWMHAIEPDELGAIGGDCDVLIDDASLVLGSDDYRSKVAESFRDLVDVRRHDNVAVLLNGQEGAALSKYAFSADAMILKPSASFFPDLDREGLGPFLKETDRIFETIDEADYRHFAMVYSRFPRFKGLIHVDAPVWYDETLSRNKAGQAKRRSLSPGAAVVVEGGSKAR